MSLENVIKQRLETVLEDHFPKDKCVERGEALVLFAMAMSEINKLISAFGRCEICYGKGFSTQMTDQLHLFFCTCGRGKGMEEIIKLAMARKLKIGS